MSEKLTAAVITISDKGSRGERIDTSGPRICSMLKEDGWDVVYTDMIPDEHDMIVNLPGSEKAAKENLEAVLDPIHHGIDMLKSSGSADCGVPLADA